MRLQWFSVRAALIGSPSAEIESAVADLQEELEMRTHLRNPRVSWDAENLWALVRVECEARVPECAAGGISDEVFESAIAVIREFDVSGSRSSA